MNKIDELELVLIKLGYAKYSYNVGLHVLLSRNISTFKHEYASESSGEQLYNNKHKSEQVLSSEMPYIFDNIVNVYTQGEEVELKVNHQFIDALIMGCFDYDDEERTVLHEGKFVSYWNVRDHYEKDITNFIELLNIFYAKLSKNCNSYESIKRATLLFEAVSNISFEDLASISNSINDSDTIGFVDFVIKTNRLGIRIKDYKEALNIYNSLN